MRVQLAGTTFDFNVSENLYYDNIERGFSAHDYLGLYKEKVRAVGKISAIITAVTTEDGIEYKAEFGELSDDRKQQICKAIEDGRNYGYVLSANRYFFVDKFYETDFKKITQHLEHQWVHEYLICPRFLILSNYLKHPIVYLKITFGDCFTETFRVIQMKKMKYSNVNTGLKSRR